MTLHLSGAEQVTPASRGLWAGTAETARAQLTAWRTLRYNDLTARLTLRGSAPGTQPAPGSAAVIDQARLSTSLTAQGLLRHHLRFHLARWSQRTVSVRLPGGAELVAAGVDGHWLDRLKPGEDGELELPVPLTATSTAAAARASRFEVLYTTRARTGWLWTRLD